MRPQLFKANELKALRVRRFQVHWQHNAASSAPFQRVTQRAPPVALLHVGKVGTRCAEPPSSPSDLAPER